MDEKPTVLCFGEALWDMPPGEKIPGGAPMNVALRLAQFGIETRLLSRVGTDRLGYELLEFMASRGLSTEHIQVDDQYPTGYVLVDTTDPSAVRYDIAQPVAWDFIDANEYFESAVHHPEVMVFGSLAGRSELSRQSLFRLLDRSRLRVFDVNLRTPFIDRTSIAKCLYLSDWVKLNETELGLIAGWESSASTLEANVQALKNRYEIEAVCVTLGAEGAILLYQEQFYRQAAFEVNVIDTIGCGDAFLSSWIAEMLKGAAPSRALERACAVGALVAASEGANSLISDEKIDAIVAG